MVFFFFFLFLNLLSLVLAKINNWKLISFWVLSDFFSFGEQHTPPPPNVVTVVRKFLFFSLFTIWAYANALTGPPLLLY